MTNYNVAIPEELGPFMKKAVESGQVAGPSELVTIALFAIRDQFELDIIKENRLRHELSLGLGQLERGQTADYAQGTFLEQMHSDFQSSVS